MGFVMSRGGWQGNHSSWRSVRRLRRNRSEAIVRKNLESLKERVPEG